MQISHRITVSSSPDIRLRLSTIGVEVPDRGLAHFEVEESSDHWPEIRQWIVDTHAADSVTTRFSSREVRDASWLRLVPQWHHGYPQPDEDSFGYLQATYDLSEFCSECGVGLRQIRPFQMKSEPRWGARSILQLNWVFGEYFATPDAWRDVFEPAGVSCLQVITPRGVTLKTVVQLQVPEVVRVQSARLGADECKACGRTKYAPVTRGEFPALLDTPSSPIVRTAEWFGSGGSARQEVLVDRGLREALEAHSVKGVTFWPASKRD